MADWTLSTASGFRPYRAPHGSPQLRYFVESTAASTATIKAGQVVCQDTVVSTGGFRICRGIIGAGGDAVNVISTNIIGVAAFGSTSDGSTGLSSNLGVFVADNKTEFLGYLSSGASASSFIGKIAPVRFDSTLGIYNVCMKSTAGDEVVKITDVPHGTVGDTNGPVIFKFTSTNVSDAVR